VTDTSSSSLDYKALGAALNKAGWQQYSFLKPGDHTATLGDVADNFGDLRWLVITHSCDLIHHSEQEVNVELLGVEAMSVGSEKELALQSSRMCIVKAYSDTGTQLMFLRARALNRLSLPRVKLQNITPDKSICLRSPYDVAGLRGKSEREIGDWLAARYNRGWTPSEFDRRLKKNVGKIQKSLIRLQSHGVADILIRVTPQDELTLDEPYEVSLIIIAAPESEPLLSAIQAEAKTFANSVQQPNLIIIATPPNVQLSTLISFEFIKGWLRFHDVFRDSLAAAADI
jgi:hypothetical protein